MKDIPELLEERDELHHLKINVFIAAIPAILLVVLPIHMLFVKKPPVMNALHPSKGFPIDLIIDIRGTKKFSFFNPNYGRLFMMNNSGMINHQSIVNQEDISKIVYLRRAKLFTSRALAWGVIFCLFTGMSGGCAQKQTSSTSATTAKATTTTVQVTTTTTAQTTSTTTTKATTTKPPETTLPYASQKKPTTALIKSYVSGSKIAPFTVKTTKDGVDYFVKLVDTSTGKVAYEFYILDGETLSTKIALGTYTLKYATGAVWYGVEHLFGPNTSYSAGSSDLQFYKSGTTINGYTITLYKVAGGNFDTKKINPTDF